eukprot:3653031-Lingulodinium_polyedra.AAC.1
MRSCRTSCFCRTTPFHPENNRLEAPPKTATLENNAQPDAVTGRRARLGGPPQNTHNSLRLHT